MRLLPLALAASLINGLTVPGHEAPRKLRAPHTNRKSLKPLVLFPKQKTASRDALKQKNGSLLTEGIVGTDLTDEFKLAGSHAPEFKGRNLLTDIGPDVDPVNLTPHLI